MKIDICAAITLDGFIARENGDTDWVKDDELFEATCKEHGCIVMGNNTFKEYGEPPFEGVEHIVLSSSSDDSKYKNVHIASSVKDAVAIAQKLGCDKLLVIGGAQTNKAFIGANLVESVILDIHPLLLTNGVKLFGDYNTEVQLSRHLTKTQNQDFARIEYKVLKEQ